MRISSAEIFRLPTWDSPYNDFRRATEENSVPLPKEFTLLAEILSEHHDKGEYFWLIKDTDKNYYVLDGSHDYTGWDCISHCSIGKPFKSLKEIHLHVQEFDNQNRPVRKLLLEQAKDANTKSS
jgi:hypothetical protein